MNDYHVLAITCITYVLNVLIMFSWQRPTGGVYCPYVHCIYSYVN